MNVQTSRSPQSGTKMPDHGVCGCVPGTKTLNLALQGGGAHGAFTWGVLDRLLEDDRLSFEGIAATSAGAMNAVVLAYGLAAGGREGAKKALANFWRRISHAAAFGMLQPSEFDRAMKDWSLDHSPMFLWFDVVSRLFSPYQFNPYNVNPLRRVLEQSVDFDVLRNAACPVQVFLGATNVRTGKIKVFDNAQLTSDAVLASACLPFLFQAVEIDGEAYWDGGYMGNPVIFPLIYSCATRDVLIVHINPLERKEVPRTSSEIMSRINEISFNSSLMREMRAIAFVSDLIDKDVDNKLDLKRMLIHGIAADDVMLELGARSKLNADWAFLTMLRDTGRERAGLWLQENFENIGKETTIDIQARFL
ncbi:patatin-like phospholipase family protein [Limibacillus sp. MBR-115]|uniref:patatin-like phospholipase family protein n=1 Tax=Limibacillus sp. MBR-115 TaxID=3156465 RepID=UPI0033938C52